MAANGSILIYIEPGHRKTMWWNLHAVHCGRCGCKLHRATRALDATARRRLNRPAQCLIAYPRPRQMSNAACKNFVIVLNAIAIYRRYVNINLFTPCIIAYIASNASV